MQSSPAPGGVLTARPAEGRPPPPGGASTRLLPGWPHLGRHQHPPELPVVTHPLQTLSGSWVLHHPTGLAIPCSTPGSSAGAPKPSLPHPCAPHHPSPPQGNLPHTCDLQPQDLRSPLLLCPDGVGQGRGAEGQAFPASTLGQGWAGQGRAPGPESPCTAVPCTRPCPFSGLNMLSVHSGQAGPC